MGATPGSQPDRGALLPHRKYLLLLGPSLPRRFATFLSLCGGDRGTACGARDLFSGSECRSCLAQCAVAQCGLAQSSAYPVNSLKPECCSISIPCSQFRSGGNCAAWAEW